VFSLVCPFMPDKSLGNFRKALGRERKWSLTGRRGAKTNPTEGSTVTQPLQCTQTQQDYQAHTYVGAHLTDVITRRTLEH
jgi:hypothetical protein